MIPCASGLGKDDVDPRRDDIFVMRLFCMIALTAALLAGCGPGAKAPPPYFAIPPGPTATPAAPGAADAPARFMVRPTPNPEVQQFLPGPSPGELGRGPAPVQQPGPSAGPFYTPPYSGPVTGYGRGGMSQPPGAPPNPPYPPGGLMALPGTVR